MFQNYGGEEDTGVLLYPSIYSNHGVYSEDFFRPHPPEKIRAIFEAIGVEMSTEMFEDLWAMAAKRDPKDKGEVRVQTMLSMQFCLGVLINTVNSNPPRLCIQV